MINNIGTRTIETSRLSLRQFEYSDAEDVFRNWASDEEMQSLYSEPVYKSLEEARKLVEKYIGCVIYVGAVGKTVHEFIKTLK